MKINKRIHPKWLERMKFASFTLGGNFLILAACLYLFSDNAIALLIFDPANLISIAKYLSVVGMGCVAALVVMVFIEHKLCSRYCAGWENHSLINKRVKPG